MGRAGFLPWMSHPIPTVASMGIRILHTSDWHLGRSFGEHSLLEEQGRFVDWLVEVVRAERIDVVAVAGDIFDRSLPRAEAWGLWWDATKRLRSAGAFVAAITGNHDSGDRLGVLDDAVDRRDLLLRGGYHWESPVTEVDLAAGPLAVVAVPFLDPRVAPAGFAVRATTAAGPEGDPDGDLEVDPGAGDRGAPGGRARVPSHERVLAVALASARRAVPRGVPSMVLSHAFVTGAEPSDSEHQIGVGEAGMVSASLYDPFDYVALGHLHRPQEVGGRAHVRYSGSPLRYSFSEAAAKEVVVVELGPGGVERTEVLPVGVGRGVAVLTGTMDELLAGSDHANWVRAEVTDTVRPVDAIRRLRGSYPHIVEMEWTGRSASVMSAGAARARSARPEELAGAFWEDATGEPPDEAVAEVLAGSLQAPPADRRDSEVAA